MTNSKKNVPLTEQQKDNLKRYWIIKNMYQLTTKRVATMLYKSVNTVYAYQSGIRPINDNVIALLAHQVGE